MSKHATGHWYVALDEDRNAIAVAENGVGPNGGWVGVDIARMALPGKYKTRLQINEHARLIAAAPDYHDIAPDALEVIEALLLQRPDDEVLQDLVERLHAAIAKAEGR